MRLTVAEKSGDMSARFVGECREVVDDDHVSVGRCAGDALQLGVVDRLTDTNLRHNHKHALACPTAEGGLVFFLKISVTPFVSTLAAQILAEFSGLVVKLKLVFFDPCQRKLP